MNSCLQCSKPVKNKFCNNSCSAKYNNKKRSRKKWSTEARKAFSKKQTGKQRKKRVVLICEICKTKFEVIPSLVKRRRFCSHKCASINSGRISASKRVKRSKNEIYFAKLCQKHFNSVLTNKSIFNGWDADIIIEDIKTAILWNGKWHYVEGLGKNHSLKQVQNRDRLKLIEIEKMNYTPYIIKDMGRENKSFVEEQFKNFTKRLR